MTLESREPELAGRIAKNAWRYVALLELAADELLSSTIRPSDSAATGGGSGRPGSQEPADIIRAQRIAHQNELQRQLEASGDATTTAQLPSQLLRTFSVVVVCSSKEKAVSVREVKASDIGRLVKIRAIVTRVGDVRPKLSVASYFCEKCGNESFKVIPSRSFTPMSACGGPECSANRSSASGSGRLTLQPKYSKFVKFQDVKIQELPDQVPMSNIPRTMTVEALNDATRACSPGDLVTVHGIFLPEKHGRGVAKLEQVERFGEQYVSSGDGD